MASDKQAILAAAMEKPEFYPHPVNAVEKRETHISIVFLTGPYAYKLKKPVNLGFLDFTTLAKRRHFCRREVSLNRRLAPDVYLDVIPITTDKNRYLLAGPGKAVEYAVKMRQLPDDLSMRKLLRRGEVNEIQIRQLAGTLVAFYRQAAVDDTKIAIGSWGAVCANCEENFNQTEMFTGSFLDERMFQIIRRATRYFLQKHRDLFDDRIAKGKIRDCHGDLRVGHVYFEEDGIKIIDCVEFNDRFRYSDSACDLAFLAMDLDFEGFPEIEQQLLQSFSRQADDNDVFVLIDFYKCYRAFVRVKVNCLRLQAGGLGDYNRNRLLRETQTYLELAYRYALNISRPTLWIIGGIIGSGKSTIAKQLGACLKARVLQSDVIRKDLFGLKPDAPADVPYGEGHYSKEKTQLAYGKLLMLAQEELKKGDSVIMDATFSSGRHRREALRLSENLDANFVIVECAAGLPAIRRRLLSREKGRSVSDARLHHLKKFRDAFEPLTEEEEHYTIRINTEASVAENIQAILSQNYAQSTRRTHSAI
jgi:aminoglycoside phosphotransferase family enzyme/predicted kinase